MSFHAILQKRMTIDKYIKNGVLYKLRARTVQNIKSNQTRHKTKTGTHKFLLHIFEFEQLGFAQLPY